MMSIEFTNHCNFRCRMCPHSVYGQTSAGGNVYNRDKGYISDEVFGLALENARKYAKSVSISFFGEQMLHPEFSKYMKKLAEDKPYKLILFSNFSLFGPATYDAVMKCDVVKISLDASDSELFEKLCPDGDFADIEANIGIWLALKNHPKTYLVYTTSSINKHDKRTFLDKWLPKMSSNDGIITKSVISYGGVMKDDYMTPNRCRVAGQNRLTVAWNGDCSPCNLDVNMEMNVGNITVQNDVADIINGKRYKECLGWIKNKAMVCTNCFDANNHRETRIYCGRRVA